MRPEEAKLPIAQVTWKSAQQYANWAGKQLPTEAMWKKTRGTDGRWYPWGNEKPDPVKHGVLSMDKALTGPQPVGSFPPAVSPCGCLNMAGNAYEWTSEWMEPYPNSSEPDAAWGHQYVVVRAGSFYHTRQSYRAAKRMSFEYNETYCQIDLRTAWCPPKGFDHKKYVAAARPLR